MGTIANSGSLYSLMVKILGCAEFVEILLELVKNVMHL